MRSWPKRENKRYAACAQLNVILYAKGKNLLGIFDNLWHHRCKTFKLDFVCDWSATTIIDQIGVDLVSLSLIARWVYTASFSVVQIPRSEGDIPANSLSKHFFLWLEKGSRVSHQDCDDVNVDDNYDDSVEWVGEDDGRDDNDNGEVGRKPS